MKLIQIFYLDIISRQPELVLKRWIVHYVWKYLGIHAYELKYFWILNELKSTTWLTTYVQRKCPQYCI